jgi:dUTPase
MLPSLALRMPTLTGKSIGFSAARSGMKEPNGTLMKRLLSTIHAEYMGAMALLVASFRRSSWLSKPCERTCGGSWLVLVPVLTVSCCCWAETAGASNTTPATARPSTGTRRLRSVITSPGCVGT